MIQDSPKLAAAAAQAHGREELLSKHGASRPAAHIAPMAARPLLPLSPVSPRCGGRLGKLGKAVCRPRHLSSKVTCSFCLQFILGVCPNCTTQLPLDFRSYPEPGSGLGYRHVLGHWHNFQTARVMFALQRGVSVHAARHCQQSSFKMPRLRRQHFPPRLHL